MSGFLFNRRTTSDETKPAPAPPSPDKLLEDAGQAQGITAAAIFAALVGKGILAADEAAGLMGEIADVIEREVDGELGASAGRTLRSYRRALMTAAE